MKYLKPVFVLLALLPVLALVSCSERMPYIGENGNWFIGESDLGVSARGPEGPKGEKGATGETGAQGPQGPKGDAGANGAAGAKGEAGQKGEKGEKGDTGSRGATGENGITPNIGENGNWWIGDKDTGVYAGGYVETCTDGLEFAFRTAGGRAGAVVCGYRGEDTEVIIPNFFAGIPVIGIDVNAFSENVTITSVRLPSGLVSLPAAAFKGCLALKEIDFGGAQILEINSEVFSETALTKILLPAGVESIDASAFSKDMSIVVYIPSSVNEIKGSFSRNAVLAFEANELSPSIENVWESGNFVRYSLGVKSKDLVYDAASGAHLVYEDGGYSILSYMLDAVGIAQLPCAFEQTPILRVRSYAVILGAEVTDLVLPAYIERLDAEAFTAEQALRSVYFPASLTQTEKGALALQCSLYLFESDVLSEKISSAVSPSFSVDSCIFSLPSGKLCQNAQYLYLLHESCVTLLRFFGNVDTLEIPSQLADKPVTAIQSGFFEGYYTTRITVPRSVNFVGRYAFVFRPYVGESGEKQYFPCKIEFEIDYPAEGYARDMIFKEEEDVSQKQVYFNGLHNGVYSK